MQSVQTKLEEEAFSCISQERIKIINEKTLSNPKYYRITTSISIDKWGNTKVVYILDRRNLLTKDEKKKIIRKLSKLKFKEVGIEDLHLYSRYSKKEIIKQLSPFSYIVPIKVENFLDRH